MRNMMILTMVALAACSGSDVPPLAPGAPAVPIDPSGYATAGAFLSCLEGDVPLVSAHRGGPAPGYPENSLEAFARTLAQVPALIETDVRQTKDGILVLFHDDDLDEKTNGQGPLAEKTYTELQKLRLRDPRGMLTDAAIPTLDEALRMLRGKTIVQLDVKRGVPLRAVVRAVQDNDAEAYAGIITYTDNGAAIVARASDEMTIFPGAEDMDDLAALNRAGAANERLVIWTGISRGSVDTRFIRELDNRDIPASGGALGTLDDRAARGERGVYRALVQDGIDIIATDRPVEAAKALGIPTTAAGIEACTL
ncbi:MAG: glycerophosphodiester phosphodiesterase family protein [Pseudomonadota bacterium]